MFVRHGLLTAVLWLLGSTYAVMADAPLLSLGNGDRILFLGNGFVENDQWHAFFEAGLQRRFSERTLTFRYMGWSGDTVRGDARTAGYQVPEGLARLEKEVLALKPTVIFLAYGMNESFAGPQALPAFIHDYGHLLKTLAPLGARLVIVSPTYHEDLGRPFPDPTRHNEELKQYTKALKEFAAEHKALFIDLYHALESAKKAHARLSLTTNGLLLTGAGYALAARAADAQLGLPREPWDPRLDQHGTLIEDGAMAQLRAAIVLRNQLFYRRWRPYNDHSRHWGFIGGDFKLYDQEIAAQERRIAELRK